MSIRKIDPADTYEAMEDQVVFTQAAVEADEQATDLLPRTEGWLPAIDEVRLFDREFRRESAKVDAFKLVSGVRLRMTCRKFGNDLYISCQQDRTVPRWLRYFAKPVCRFVRMPIGDQVMAVRGWLMDSGDPVVEQHRPALQQNVSAADQVQVRAAALPGRRAQLLEKRADLAAMLTHERDGLFEALAARARERKLPRDWPRTFFRTGNHQTARKTSGGSRSAAPASTPSNGNPAPVPAA